MPYVLDFESEHMKTEWLPRMASGDAITSVGMTEPGTGSDLQAIHTQARKDGDEYVINGAKTFITNGHLADVVVLVAKTAPDLGARGLSLILVETNTPGFRRGRNLDKIGQKAQDTAELFFDDVRVPLTNLIGEENKGFVYMMKQLAQERMAAAVNALGCAKGILADTVRYTKDQKVFGNTVWS